MNIKDEIEDILYATDLKPSEVERLTEKLLNLHIVSNRISDEEIKRYRKEGRLSGATKREPFYKLIAQKFDERYEYTDFDIMYDC